MLLNMLVSMAKSVAVFACIVGLCGGVHYVKEVHGFTPAYVGQFVPQPVKDKFSVFGKFGFGKAKPTECDLS